MAAVRSPRAQSLHTTLLTALVVSALAELLILRTFTRTAIHIPALSALQAPYEALAFTGRYAYFVSLALLLVALPVLALALAGDRRTGGRAAAGGIALFFASAAAGAWGSVSPFVVDAGTLAAFALVLGVAGSRWHGRALAPIALLGITFLAAGGFTLLQAAAQDGLASPGGSSLLTIAELSGCAFALATPLMAASRPSRASVLAGVAVAAVVFLCFIAGGGSTSRILLLWNEGLSGALPGEIYAAAAGALVIAFVSLFRGGQQAAAIGLALLIAGGLGLHNTYQTGLVIAGLAALCIAPTGPLAAGRCRSARPAAAEALPHQAPH